jgi:hypothetical protein
MLRNEASHLDELLWLRRFSIQIVFLLWLKTTINPTNQKKVIP